MSRLPLSWEIFPWLPAVTWYTYRLSKSGTPCSVWICDTRANITYMSLFSVPGRKGNCVIDKMRYYITEYQK